MSLENEPNRTPSDLTNQSSLGAALSGSATNSSEAAPRESSHEVIVWDLPAELAENEGRHELECNTCGVIGAIENSELASKLAALHVDFFGPLRDLAGGR